MRVLNELSSASTNKCKILLIYKTVLSSVSFSLVGAALQCSVKNVAFSLFIS